MPRDEIADAVVTTGFAAFRSDAEIAEMLGVTPMAVRKRRLRLGLLRRAEPLPVEEVREAIERLAIRCGSVAALARLLGMARRTLDQARVGSLRVQSETLERWTSAAVVALDAMRIQPDRRPIRSGTPTGDRCPAEAVARLGREKDATLACEFRVDRKTVEAWRVTRGIARYLVPAEVVVRPRTGRDLRAQLDADYPGLAYAILRTTATDYALEQEFGLGRGRIARIRARLCRVK